MKTLKPILDIFIGAVIPILILNNLTQQLGAELTYVVAALIPVVYTLADTFFISRRFNVITSYVALAAIMNGVLAFWWVDGWRFAIKDTAALLVSSAVFAGSLLLGKPIMRFFMAQILMPDTPAKQNSLERIFAQGNVKKALVVGTCVVLTYSVIAAVVNFFLNLNIVLAPFGGETFNQQVAQVNAITRIAFTLANLAAFGFGFWHIYRALFAVLPSEEGKAQIESDFWTLVDRSSFAE
jgi:hypothetical protein